MTAIPSLSTASNAEQQQQEEDAPVDTTPISPTQQTLDSLSHRIAHRPDPQDLVNRGIMFDPKTAPAIQQAQHELERQRAADALKRGLEKRSEKEELIERM